jgi:hypothetical protein
VPGIERQTAASARGDRGPPGRRWGVCADATPAHRAEGHPNALATAGREIAVPRRWEARLRGGVFWQGTTFGTVPSKAGVSPRTAQSAMPHSRIDLTMNVYTDPQLLDVTGPVDTLPALTLGGEGRESDAAKATGTENSTASPLVPSLVATGGDPGYCSQSLTRRQARRRKPRTLGHSP